MVLRVKAQVAKLSQPDYVTRAETGLMVGLACKMCGAPIAVQGEGYQLVRLNNYAELKMKFPDNSYHVTNICTGCLGKGVRKSETLKALWEADLDDLIKDLPQLESMRDRGNPKLVSTDTSKKGLL